MWETSSPSLPYVGLWYLSSKSLDSKSDYDCLETSEQLVDILNMRVSRLAGAVAFLFSFFFFFLFTLKQMYHKLYN